jgi:hypothetical protein
MSHRHVNLQVGALDRRKRITRARRAQHSRARDLLLSARRQLQKTL